MNEITLRNKIQAILKNALLEHFDEIKDEIAGDLIRGDRLSYSVQTAFDRAMNEAIAEVAAEQMKTTFVLIVRRLAEEKARGALAGRIKQTKTLDDTQRQDLLMRLDAIGGEE